MAVSARERVTTVSASSGPMSMWRRASAEAMPSSTPTGCMMAACIQRSICPRSRQELFALVMIAPVLALETKNQRKKHYLPAAKARTG